jgi:uncharacterized YkwD family protein
MPVLGLTNIKLMNRRGSMRKKYAVAIILMVTLLVVSMASTAFAGNFVDTGRCETTVNKKVKVNKESGPRASEKEKIGVMEVLIRNKPEVPVEQPEAPVVEQPEVPVEQPEAPVVEQPEVPVEEEPEVPVAEEPKGPADQNLSGLSVQEREMVEYVNQERVKAGIAPLQVDLELARVARIKSQDMVDNGYFDHNSPTHGSPFEMMRSFGISYRSAGENIAKNSSVMGAHTALMNSEGHRANILNPGFTHIGIGIVGSGGMVTITQVFIAK